MKNYIGNLATFHFTMLIIGYIALAATVVNFVGEEVSRVTYGFRGVMFVISVWLIFKNMPRTALRPWAVTWFFVFWIMYAVRIVYDCNFTFSSDPDWDRKTQIYLFMVMLPSMFAIYKTWDLIDYKISLIHILLLGSFALAFSLIFNVNTGLSDEYSREGASAALFTITYGQSGVMLFLVAAYLFFCEKTHILFKLIAFFAIILGVYVMLRSGSRSPFVALIGCVFCWLVARSKHWLIATFLALFLLTLLIVFAGDIISLVGKVSPVLESRLGKVLEEGMYGSSGRDVLWSAAISAGWENPLFGYGYRMPAIHIYPHNMHVESFMALGFPGAIILYVVSSVACLCAFMIVRRRASNAWIALLFLQQYTFNRFSGAFYLSEKTVILMLLVLLVYKYIKMTKGQGNVISANYPMYNNNFNPYGR